jgi:hypothetical protein
MACVDTLSGTSLDTSAGFERVRYFPRQLLTADDMRLEQEYFRDKQRRHNRFLHGWGVVWGLEVRLDPDRGPLAVQICPGYALGPCGDEIYVPEAIPFDLGTCLRRPADPCADSLAATMAMPPAVVVSIRYAECQTRPLRTLQAGCGCDDTACEYSRIRDGFDVRCRPGTAIPPSPISPGICEIEDARATAAPAPPAPPVDPWVDLAQISVVPANGAVSIDPAKIDNGVRRRVYSSAMIQQQVIACCCQAK